MLISQAMRNTNIQSSARVLGGTVVISEKFITNCLSLFDEAMQQKAEKVQTPLASAVSSLCSLQHLLSCPHQELKSNPVFLITEEDLKQAAALTESSAPSKKDKKDAERRKKAAGLFRPT